jgi:beta-N-acetylhexosaminidase
MAAAGRWDVTYCEGWDARWGVLVGPLLVRVARQRTVLAIRRTRQAGSTTPIAVCLLVTCLLFSGCDLGASSRGSSPPHRSPPGTAASAAPTDSQAGASPASGNCRLPPLRQQLAQLLLVGFPGTTPTPANRWVVEQGVGGLVLFSRNISSAAQVRSLLRHLQASAAIPLEIAVDEEPGRIARLAGVIATAPPARQVGRLPPPQIFQYGLRIGRDLTALGVTTDLAPVLDITDAPPNSVIGDRSFGSDPAGVSRAAVAFMLGLTHGGVTTVGKHFPGHGESAIDSHLALPIVDVTASRLQAWDLAPYKAAIKDGLPAVMVGHLLVRRLDPQRPASLSPVLVKGLLRERLGFDGLVVSDALEMDAIARSWPLPTAAELAIQAGVDQVIVWRDYARIPQIIDRLEDGVRSGRLSPDRIREAFLRVQRFKRQPAWDGCARIAAPRP